MEELQKRRISSRTSIPVEMISCNNSERIHFDGINLYGNEPPLKNFMESDRVFSSIMLENVKLLKDHNLFWEKCGKNFSELIIKKCFISASDFLVILKNLTNLTKLVFIDSSNFCRSLFIEIEKANKVLFASASKLSSFIIDESWTGLGSAALFKWLSEMPNLTEFEISMVDENLFIVDCLKLWENQLTSLRLKNKISVQTRNKIYKLNMSELKVFQIGSVETYDFKPDEDDGNSLIEFVSRQHNLLEFGVGICQVDENFLIKLSGNVANLKILGIYNTYSLNHVSSSEVLAFFAKLSMLNLSISSYNSFDTFLGSSNTNLTHLTYHIPIEEYEVRSERRRYDIPFAVITDFLNLTHFDVYDQYICGYDIQDILRLLTKLKVLRVLTMHTLSDFAFSGKGWQYPNTQKNVEYSKSGHAKKVPFYQLERLQNLIELDIVSSDNKFTDKALERISKLEQLRILNLTNYTKITISGVAKVVSMCKNLEQINITGCKQIIANKISSHFKKLKVIFEK